MKVVLTFCFLVCLSSVGFGQVENDNQNDQFIRCNTDESYERILKKYPQYKETRKDLEEKVQEIINNRDVIDGIIVIPVVYHVIHNGDPVGSNENLPESLLMSQLEQMSDDFRRMNSDAGNTPSDFVGVAADTEIEFCLTSIDENGDPHSGINRINISTLSGVSEADCWDDDYIDTNIKIPTVWDAANFLNIWTTVKIQRSSDCANTILGYAQFPGMAANTDGIVLRATTVGSIDNPNPAGGAFSIGRTGTHEVGHYLNVFHVFQGAGCGSDLVADTPTQDDPNYIGSPCTYPGPDSCDDGSGDLPDMFMNYMDYSDDTCMNLFTQGQKTRMIAAINASRPGLLTAVCGAECEDFTTVSGTLNGEYYADIDLTSSGVTTVPSTNDVILGATGIVSLQAGFDVIYGGGLSVVFGDCSDAFTSEDDPSYRSIQDELIHKDRNPDEEVINRPMRKDFTSQELEEYNRMLVQDRSEEVLVIKRNKSKTEREKRENEASLLRDRSNN